MCIPGMGEHDDDDRNHGDDKDKRKAAGLAMIGRIHRVYNGAHNGGIAVHNVSDKSDKTAGMRALRRTERPCTYHILVST